MGILKRPGDTSREYDSTGVFVKLCLSTSCRLSPFLAFLLTGSEHHTETDLAQDITSHHELLTFNLRNPSGNQGLDVVDVGIRNDQSRIHPHLHRTLYSKIFLCGAMLGNYRTRKTRIARCH